MICQEPFLWRARYADGQVIHQFNETVEISSRVLSRQGLRAFELVHPFKGVVFGLLLEPGDLFFFRRRVQLSYGLKFLNSIAYLLGVARQGQGCLFGIFADGQVQERFSYGEDFPFTPIEPLPEDDIPIT